MHNYHGINALKYVPRRPFTYPISLQPTQGGETEGGLENTVGECL